MPTISVSQIANISRLIRETRVVAPRDYEKAAKMKTSENANDTSSNSYIQLADGRRSIVIDQFIIEVWTNVRI